MVTVDNCRDSGDAGDTGVDCVRYRVKECIRGQMVGLRGSEGMHQIKQAHFEVQATLATVVPDAPPCDIYKRAGRTKWRQGQSRDFAGAGKVLK